MNVAANGGPSDVSGAVPPEGEDGRPAIAQPSAAPIGGQSDSPPDNPLGNQSDIAPDVSPERVCALTRAAHRTEDLIRFVAAPDGTIIADVAGKLPGRGVWIECRRQAVVEAQRRNVFARSLKRTTIAAADLPDRVEALLLRRTIDALALANKAGLVVAGFTKVSVALESPGITGLLHGAEAARDGVEKLDRKFNAVMAAGPGNAGLGDVIMTELTIDEISLAIGRPNVVHAALRSGGASANLLEHARRLRRFREPRAPSHQAPSH